VYKILSIAQAKKTARRLHKQGKTIVLAGGCFDVLHSGHIIFLKKAKKRGDALFVLLESDENVTKRKGKDRPINKLEKRAEKLSELSFIDFIIPLYGVTNDAFYDKIVIQLRPSVIALTEGDPNTAQRKKQSELVGGKVEFVTKRIEGFSTTDLVNKGNIDG